jgi:hypothetical protein
LPDRSAGLRWGRRLLGATTVIIALVVVARWPMTTAVGSNFHVTVKRITLFEKTVAFVDRDLQMRRLTKEVAGTGGTRQQRLLRMYEWVAGNIHPTPPGLPVIDDHVWHIFVRQYGEVDQRAEALAMLATDDGMPASTIPLGKLPTRRLVQLTVVNLDGRLVLFDVNNRVVFRKPSGELATLNDLQTDPSLIKENGSGVMVDGSPYEEYFVDLKSYRPSFVRMEKQRVWPRLKDELLKQLSGW